MSFTGEVSGTILWGCEFEVVCGTLSIEDGIIVDLVEEDVSSDLLVAPSFVNSHTHVGDSVLKDPPITSLDELVRPPDGLKHRILRSTPADELVRAMSVALLDMVRTGTGAFVDFREGGVDGVRALGRALAYRAGLKGVILGRPDGCGVSEVLSLSDGLGLSGVYDMYWDYLVEIASLMKYSGKIFGFHAGEKDGRDIGAAFDLEPDFVVHLTHGTIDDFKRAFEADCGVVVCPRSNLLTGVGMPDIEGMLDSGLVVGVGTDNVMLNSVNMFAEMEFMSKIFLHDDRQVFKLCTLNGAKIFGLDDELGSIEDGKRACLMLLDRNSSNLRGVRDPIAGLVRRARPDDIVQIIGVE